MENSVNKDPKIYLFEDMAVPKAVLKLTIPSIISMMVMMLYSMADTYFVGLLNDSVQNAAVTLAGPVLLAFNAINNLFGVGCSSLMSRALGRKDYVLVKKTSAFGFYCSIFSGLLFALICTVFWSPLLHLLGADAVTFQTTSEYMVWAVRFGAIPSILNVVLAHIVRSEGASIHASVGTMSGCLLNIVLDPIMIHGFGMGAEGAGLATFISNCFACLYFFVLIYVKSKKKTTFVSLAPKYFGFGKIVVFGVCAVGIPASIQNLLNVTGMTILNNFASEFGATAVASIGIAQKVNQIPTMMSFGYTSGITSIVAYNFAAKNGKRMKEVIYFVAKTMVPILLLCSIVFYIFAPALIRVFMNNADIIAYGTRFLRGFCLGVPFLAFDFLGVGLYQAIGKGQYSLIFAVLRKIVLEIPAIILLNKLFPLYGLAYSQFVSEFILSIAAFILIRKILKNVTKNEVKEIEVQQ